MTNNNWEEEFIEKGADLEYDRWSNWQKYLHSKLDFSTGKYVLPEDDFERWNRQIHTPYSELSDREKEYDRIEVRKYLPLVQELLTKKDQEHKAELEMIRGEIEELQIVQNKDYGHECNDPFCKYCENSIRNEAIQDDISILDSHINKLSTE